MNIEIGADKNFLYCVAGQGFVYKIAPKEI